MSVCGGCLFLGVMPVYGIQSRLLVGCVSADVEIIIVR